MEINPAVDPAPQPPRTENPQDSLPPVTPAPAAPPQPEQAPIDDGLGVVVDVTA